MSGAASERWTRARWLLVLALFALPLGAAFDGAVAWIHSHGHRGGHLHLLAAEHEAAAHGEWHAAEHRHEHAPEPEPDDEEREDRPGVLVDLPEGLAASARGSGTIPSSRVLAQAPLLERQALTPAVASGPPGVVRSGWPPQRGRRSGVAALLCSSHALLL